MKFAQCLVYALPIFVLGCASSTGVQPAASSHSGFEGATYVGQTVELEKPTPGAEQYRVFQQGGSGFVSIQSVRESAEEIAANFCGRKGKVFRGVSETAAKPPYVLGNFPRIELVFECTDKPVTQPTQVQATSKYEKLVSLKKLVDAGALTQQEYESEKAKVLAEP